MSMIRRIAVAALLVIGIAGLIPSTAATAVSKTSLESEVIALTNQHRATVGCGPLAANATLAAVARSHSEDMGTRNYFEHVNPDGVDPFQRMEAAGYKIRTAGENLAAGRWRPTEVVQQWLDSPPHRANIENCAFTEIGVGVAGIRGSAYRYYWTQALAAPQR